MVSDWDSAGFIYFYPQTVQPGDLFTMYQQYFFEDTLNNMQLEKQWEDSMLHMQHYRYQQYYKNIEVEAAEFTEHAGEDGYLVFANGKVCQDLNKESIPLISETAALARLLDSMATYTFAWADTSWENELKFDLNDSTATYYPTGQLIFALDNYRNLTYLIPRSKYRLAWKFEIFCLKPAFQKDFFVDANNGQIFREDDLIETDGPANILTQGTKNIDTRSKGILNPTHILHTNFTYTNGDDRNIETRYWVDNGTGAYGKAWWVLPDVTNSNDQWYNQDQLATTPHWMASQAWDYFYYVHQRNGLNGKGKQIRIKADDTLFPNAAYGNSNQNDHPKLGNDYLYIGFVNNNYLSTIDIIGHEFTHGITQYTADIGHQFEPGALNESFSDIFGTLIEGYAEGGITDWVQGEDANLPSIYLRSLEAPKTLGSHPDANCQQLILGQPDTYNGQFWSTATVNCDQGGVHTNNSVQNFWFYLLAEGGSGVNDNLDTYNIQGIGTYEASNIVYWNLSNILGTGDIYVDARAGSIAAARLIFGECSNEEIQTTNAWAAVGVGHTSTCVINGMNKHAITEKPFIYPNPTNNEVWVVFPSSKEHMLKLYTLSGSLIKDIGISESEKMMIDISDLPKGFYLLKIKQNNQIVILKLVKD